MAIGDDPCCKSDEHVEHYAEWNEHRALVFFDPLNWRLERCCFIADECEDLALSAVQQVHRADVEWTIVRSSLFNNELECEDDKITRRCNDLNVALDQVFLLSCKCIEEHAYYCYWTGNSLSHTSKHNGVELPHSMFAH